MDQTRNIILSALLLSAASSSVAADRPLPTKLPEGFVANLFAQPPLINYPVFIAAAPTGEVFVSVDKNGSLDTQPKRGSIVKLIDKDGDGVADERKEFVPDVDSPRGICVSGDTVFCLHPPDLTAYRDKDGDGVAEESKVLIKGIGWDLSKRPADHCSNGVTMGMDGWLYLAIGDFAFMEAVGTDGTKLQLRAGGVVRVRPDGSHMEVFTRGTRNIFQVAIDPYLHAFSRDNTNDGGGWDIRVHSYFYGADMGYPRLFKNFTDETMPSLNIYGGGSGVGGTFIQDPHFPAPFNNMLYTVDWGTNSVYYHPVKGLNGAHFDIGQETFCQIERPTEITTDAQGQIFLASWKGADYKYAGEEPGYIVRIVTKDRKAEKFPDLAKADAEVLKTQLKSECSTGRLAAQQELVSRIKQKGANEKLQIELGAGSVPVQITALFGAKQAYGAASHPLLMEHAKSGSPLRECALRALADRPEEGKDVPSNIFIDALSDPSDLVKAQAIIGLSRLGRKEAGAQILAIAATPGPKQAGAQPGTDASRALPHIASRALMQLNAHEACFQALDAAQSEVEAALRVLRNLHTPETVNGLIERLAKVSNPAISKGILTALLRLYHREAPWKGDSWGTRPDTSGPYYQQETWAESAKIDQALQNFLAKATPEIQEFAKGEMARHKVKLTSQPVAVSEQADPQWAKDLEALAKAMPNVTAIKAGDVGNLEPVTIIEEVEKVLAAKEGDPKLGEKFFASHGCVACHTVAKDAPPKGPNLFDIGKRYKTAEIVTSIINPSATVAQGFPTHYIDTKDGQSYSGFIIREAADEVILRAMNAGTVRIKTDNIKKRETNDRVSSMTPGLSNNLSTKELAHLIAYLQSLTQ